MAWTGTGIALGDAMLAAIDAAVASSAEAGPAQRRAIWRAIGTAIIAHLVANGTGAVAVVSVSGVTTGAGVSGPGTGNVI